MKSILLMGLASTLLLTAAPAYSADGPDDMTIAQCAAVSAIFEHMWGLPEQQSKKTGAAAHYAGQRADLTKRAVSKAKARVGASKATEEVNILIIRFVTYYMGDLPGRFQPTAAQCSQIGLVSAPA